MIRLPAQLTRRLESLLPRARDRDRFVAECVERALDAEIVTAPSNTPTLVGGTLHLFTDGGSRGNPGNAAIGCVLIDPVTGAVLAKRGVCIGIQTNNIAEYRALVEGLTMAVEFHPNHLVCHLDSELVVRQLKGEYKVKMATFQPLIEQISKLRSQLPSVHFVHIPRSQNSLADALVNRALDQAQIHPGSRVA